MMEEGWLLSRGELSLYYIAPLPLVNIYRLHIFHLVCSHAFPPLQDNYNEVHHITCIRAKRGSLLLGPKNRRISPTNKMKVRIRFEERYLALWWNGVEFIMVVSDCAPEGQLKWIFIPITYSHIIIVKPITLTGVEYRVNMSIEILDSNIRIQLIP